MTRLRSRLPLPVWGALGIALMLLAGYVIFGGRFGLAPKPFELKAVFRSESQLGFRSPVRIAGVDVGKVTDVQPLGSGSDAAIITMRIEPEGLPIHRDATAKIRSRLLLEGNFFVDLAPGSPSEPVMRSGQTISADRTSGPVQLDRVLSDLDTDTRTSLRTALQGFGQALGAPPGSGAPNPATPGDDPVTAGETAGQSLNDSLADAPEALLGTARVNQALQGLSAHDLSQIIRGQSKLLSALASRETDLAGLIGSFDTTMAAFADRQNSLQQAVSILPDVLARARPALDALRASFPATRAFARELTPSIGELAPTIDAALPWLDQAGPLMSRAELGGLAPVARRATRAAAGVTASVSPALRQLDLLDRCMLHNLLPVSRLVVRDPPLTTGVPVFREFFQTFVGVASAFQNFDGNGTYGRALLGGGSFPVATSPLEGDGPLRGNATRPVLGQRPAYPAKEPPIRRDVPCFGNARPDVNGAKTSTGRGP